MTKKVGNYEQEYVGKDPKTGKEIWTYKHRRIAGVKVGDGSIIHHRDGNPHNNSKSNLQKTTMSGHNKIDPKHKLGGRKPSK